MAVVRGSPKNSIRRQTFVGADQRYSRLLKDRSWQNGVASGDFRRSRNDRRDRQHRSAGRREKRQHAAAWTSRQSAGKMHADLTKVRQILLNLLSNSCKFTDHGTISLRVDRRTIDHRDWMQFQVEDTGIGITAEQKENCFGNFPRLIPPSLGSMAEPASAWRSLIALFRSCEGPLRLTASRAAALRSRYSFPPKSTTESGRTRSVTSRTPLLRRSFYPVHWTGAQFWSSTTTRRFATLCLDL